MSRRIGYAGAAGLLMLLMVCPVRAIENADMAGGAQRARELLTAREYDDARARYEALIGDYPDAPEVAQWYRNLVDCYWNMSKYPEAFAAYDKAIELVSDTKTKLAWKKHYSELCRNAGRRDKAGELSSEVIAEYRKLIAEQPNAPELAEWYRELVDCYWSVKNYAECFAAYDKAIELAPDPNTKVAWKKRYAALCRDAGQEDKSGKLTSEVIAEYQKLIAEQPDEPQVAQWYRDLVDCYWGMKNYPDCFAAYDKAIESASDPNTRVAWKKHYAGLCSDARQYEKAGELYSDIVAEYRRLIAEHRNAPEVAQWHRELVDCYCSMGKYQEAFAAYDRAIESISDPNTKVAWKKHYSTLCRDAGREDKAGKLTGEVVADYQKLIAEQPTAPQAAQWHRDLVDCYWSMGKYQEAFAAYDKAIDLVPDPNTKVAWKKHYAGLCCDGRQYEKAGELYGQVIAEYRKLIAEQPTAPQAVQWYRDLVDCHWSMENYTECFAAYDKAIELAPDPNTKVAWKKHYAGLCWSKGRHDKARELYSQIIAEYRKLIADHPNAPEVAQWYRELVDCYWSMNKYRDSLAAYDKAIEFASDPLTKLAWEKHCAELCRSVELPDKADELDNEVVAEYRKLIAERPNSPQVAQWYRELVDCYWSMRQYEEAFAAYDEAIELASDPHTKVTWKKLYSELCRNVGRHDKAGKLDSEVIAECRKLMAEHPDAPQVHQWFRYVKEGLLNQRKYDEAVAFLKSAIQRYPQYRWEATLWLGETYCIFARDYDNAYAVLTQLLDEMPPEDQIPVQARVDRRMVIDVAAQLAVYALTRMGRMNEAVRMIRETLSKNSNLHPDERAQYTEWIGDIYFGADRYGEAAEAYKDLLRIDGVSEDMQAKARYHLGLCSDKLGDRALAADYMREVTNRYANTAWAKNARGMLYLWGQLKTTNTSGEH